MSESPPPDLADGSNNTPKTACFLHPLHPLKAQEIRLASSLVRDHVGVSLDQDPKLEKLRFVAVSLQEPHRAAVSSSTAPPRQAQLVTLDPTSGLVTEFVVDLAEESAKTRIVSSKTLPAGTQPMFTPEDCDLAEEIAKESPQLQAVLKERYGITDIVNEVACDPWSVHLACDEDRKLTQWRKDGVPGRLVQTFLYQRQYGDHKQLQDNHYAHPIDIVPVVDLNARKVVHIDGLDRLPPPKIPTPSVNYHRDLLQTNTFLQTSWRSDVAKALNIQQPDGPSFTVSDDNHVEWQKWSFRVGFNYREGLVLHQVSFDGRPVMHRSALVEMAVPYADPYPPHHRKCAFDVGDYGLGYCANSLSLGCDCLDHIHYFDAVLPDAHGQPQTKPKVVCMHEEDGGLLWKHVEYRNGHNESRRSRELVLSFIATVVNYEYLFYWRLKQDGLIEFEIKLSGELSTNLPSVTEDPASPTHGVLVSPMVNAQVHQHMFCARLDMSVDGHDNIVSEIDVVPQPLDPVSNPYGNCFGTVETVFKTEKEAIRVADQTKARTWKISSASKKNAMNAKPTAYKLVPFTRGAAQPVLMVNHDTCEVAKKGAFAKANLWVTPYTPEQRFPSGEYTPQGDGSNGLPDWTAVNRSLGTGEDDSCKDGLVVWHAFGVCHVPRAEDFPVMPVEVTGFSLKPDNFFEGNPAIDIPPETNKTSKLANGCCH